MNLEIIRTLILAIGWPILIVGSIFMLRATFVFYRDVKRGAIGKLVFLMAVVQTISMQVMAVFGTMLILVDLRVGVAVVLPGFFVWFFIFVIALVVTTKWGKEGIKINKLNENLEVKIQERTNDLKRTNDELVLQQKKMESHTKELEKFNRLMVDRELRMIELKKKIKELGGGTSW